MSKNVRRRGFTLPEVLVTITIVAVLAAVVVPAVLNQVSRGDNAALAGDVGALRTAITNFTTDTRNYPKYIGQLITPITTSDSNLTNVTYSANAVASWKGPYFPTSQSVGTGTYSTTAFNMTIASAFTVENNYITLNFSGAGATMANAATIDCLYDGGSGATASNPNCGGVNATPGSAAGSILWTEAASQATDPCNVTSLRWRLVSAAQ
jgi:prepilin-type N-terminal cleavage/methylation domain-containing protein